MITLLFDSNLQFQDKSGAILTGGILNVYYNSSSDTNKTSAPTYSDAYGTVRNPFDIILDNNGRAVVYVASDYVYRLEVYDQNRNLLWTTKDIMPNNGVAIEGTKIIHILGDEYISVSSRNVNNHYYYNLSLQNLSELSGTCVYRPWAQQEASGQLVVYGSRWPTYTMASINGVDMGYLVPTANSATQTDLFLTYKAGGGAGGLDWVSASPAGDGKVAVNAGKTPNYLKNVLVSDCDEISLTEVGNQYRVGINLVGESDPKLATIDEFAIDSATSNYGSYELRPGYSKLIWNDSHNMSYAWLNAKVYQCMRISDAQGTITKCNVAICGSVCQFDPPACLNIGVFDALGNLLGMTGLKFYGEDFHSGTELCSFDMTEISPGSLRLKRNTRYIVQVWSIGLQLAGIGRGDTYNYVYDYDLRQNLTTTTSQPLFFDPNGSFYVAQEIPFVSFGAADMSGS